MSEYEREVLFRLAAMEKRLAAIEERIEKFNERVHLIEVAQAQVKVIAIAFTTLSGIIATVVGKLWR